MRAGNDTTRFAGRALGACAALALLVAPTADAAGGAAAKRKRAPKPRPAPCLQASKQAFVTGGGHDHLDLAQHQVSCRFTQAAYLPLDTELSLKPDVMLGEMDVKGDLAAVAVAFPESGFLLFDVKDPAQPRFLSWYRSSQCEGLAADVDCGAYVDLSADGKLAYIATQQTTVVPGDVPLGVRPFALPGIEVVDISVPALPRLAYHHLATNLAGVHTTKTFTVPDGPSNGPRAPGEYVASVLNGEGIELLRVDRNAAGATLESLGVTRAAGGQEHDTFFQDDPILGRTLMYVAGGFFTGFTVYDVTDPSDPKFLGAWDITPRCGLDWYAHTIDVKVKNGRRFVTLPAELFDNGPSSDGDPKCGSIAGSADKPGPLWVVDATDFSKLADLEEPDTAIEAKSRAALVTTWTNAAGTPGGYLLQAVHNQQIVGDTIFASAYHAGVLALDAKDVFAGKKGAKLRETGVVVPHAGSRPMYSQPVPPLLIPFISKGFHSRPIIWDMQWHKGYVLAADEFGGLYSFRFAGDDEAAAKGRASVRN